MSNARTYIEPYHPCQQEQKKWFSHVQPTPTPHAHAHAYFIISYPIAFTR